MGWCTNGWSVLYKRGGCVVHIVQTGVGVHQMGGCQVANPTSLGIKHINTSDGTLAPILRIIPLIWLGCKDSICEGWNWEIYEIQIFQLLWDRIWVWQDMNALHVTGAGIMMIPNNLAIRLEQCWQLCNDVAGTNSIEFIAGDFNFHFIG